MDVDQTTAAKNIVDATKGHKRNENDVKLLQQKQEEAVQAKEMKKREIILRQQQQQQLQQQQQQKNMMEPDAGYRGSGHAAEMLVDEPPPPISKVQSEIFTPANTDQEDDVPRNQNVRFRSQSLANIQAISRNETAAERSEKFRRRAENVRKQKETTEKIKKQLNKAVDKVVDTARVIPVLGIDDQNTGKIGCDVHLFAGLPLLTLIVFVGVNTFVLDIRAWHPWSRFLTWQTVCIATLGGILALSLILSTIRVQGRLQIDIEGLFAMTVFRASEILHRVLTIVCLAGVCITLHRLYIFFIGYMALMYFTILIIMGWRIPGFKIGKWPDTWAQTGQDLLVACVMIFANFSQFLECPGHSLTSRKINRAINVVRACDLSLLIFFWVLFTATDGNKVFNNHQAYQGWQEVINSIDDGNFNDIDSASNQFMDHFVSGQDQSRILVMIWQNSPTMLIIYVLVTILYYVLLFTWAPFGVEDIHTCACRGDCDMMRFLLVTHQIRAQDVNDSAADDFFRTPIHYAAIYGHIEACAFLIIFGADPTAVDSNGQGVLHFAAMNGHVNLLEYFVEGKFGEQNFRVLALALGAIL